VCGLPHTQETQSLGESAGKTPDQLIAAAVEKVHADAGVSPKEQVARVAGAVNKVWMDSDLNAMFDKDIHDPKKHWTCKYCHRQCKTIQCRQFCHDEHCGATIKFGKSGVGRMGIASGQRVTQAFADSVLAANKALHAAETAKSDAEFRAAMRAVKNVLTKQKSDLGHYQRQQGYADSINKMAYPTEKQKEAQDKAMEDIEEANNKSEIERANDDTKETEKINNKNEATIDQANSADEADGAMGGAPSLAKEVQTDIDAEDDTLKNGDKTTNGQTAEMTEVSNVAAEVEKLGVKVEAASSEAQNSASSSEEYDASAMDTIEDAERELGDAKP